MERTQFEQLMRMAKALRGVNSDDRRDDFLSGFQRGLRRLFHGENFGTIHDHNAWMGLAMRDESRRHRGTGYRAGFHYEGLAPIANGEDLRRVRDLLAWSTADLAEVAAVSPRTVEGWEQGRAPSASALKLIQQYLMIAS